MVLASDYLLMDVFVTFTELFRRRDIGGWGKAGWVVCMIVLPGGRDRAREEPA